jgi:hypothetical protein
MVQSEEIESVPIPKRTRENFAKMRVDSVADFREMLKNTLKGDERCEYDVRDLYTAYKKFVKQNDLQLISRTRFGIEMSKEFNGRRSHGHTFYDIDWSE